MKGEPTVYRVDRPAAWGQVGLGVLFVLVPLSLIVAFSIPGVFANLFPNAPKTRAPEAVWLLAAVAVGFIGAGAFFLIRAARTLRDDRPKLEFDERGVTDHRGGTTTAWGEVVGISFNSTVTGSRVNRAVITLSVGGAYSRRQVEIDVRGLSEPLETIYAQLTRAWANGLPAGREPQPA